MFLLVNEGTVKRYKGDLAEETEPQITELLNRAEQGLELLMKKETQLQTKVSRKYLYPFFIVTNSCPQLDSAKLRLPRPTAGTTAAQKLEIRRHQMIMKQRERLEEERKALKAEVETLVFRSFLLTIAIFNLRLQEREIVEERDE